jgi:hypothetical protein
MPETPETWWPTAEQIQELLPTRLQGMDSSRSRPSMEQVEGLIAQAASELAPELGNIALMPSPGRERICNLARWAITLNTGSLVEANFFPEQQDAGQAERLYQRYIGALTPLRMALQGQSIPVAEFSGSVPLRPCR